MAANDHASINILPGHPKSHATSRHLPSAFRAFHPPPRHHRAECLQFHQTRFRVLRHVYAAHAPPRPARTVVGGTDPEQGDEAGEEGDSAETEPPGSEQHDRRQRGYEAAQRKRTFHTANVI